MCHRRAVLVVVLWGCAVARGVGQACPEPLPTVQVGAVPRDERREAATRYMTAMHAAQRRAMAESGRYVQLHELRGLPDVPVGFVPKLVADRWSYMIALKDLLDACGFALMSDDHEVIHIAYPRRIPSSQEQR